MISTTKRTLICGVWWELCLPLLHKRFLIIDLFLSHNYLLLFLFLLSHSFHPFLPSFHLCSYPFPLFLIPFPPYSDVLHECLRRHASHQLAHILPYSLHHHLLTVLSVEHNHILHPVNKPVLQFLYPFPYQQTQHIFHMLNEQLVIVGIREIKNGIENRWEV